MKRGLKERKLLRRYLLGALDEEQHERLEQRLLLDEALLEELSRAENDIIYEYLSGALSGQDAARFRDHFLATPERRQKLEFFSALVDEVRLLPEDDDALPRSRKPFLFGLVGPGGRAVKLGLMCAVLIILLGSWLLFFQPWRANRPDNDTPSLVVSLPPDKARRAAGGEMPRVHIPEGTSVVELRMQLGADDHQAYRAALFTDQQVEKFTGDNLESQPTANTRIVSLRVPAAILERGDYRLKLKGRSPTGEFQEVDDFSFRVLRN